jgi:hypothetical protein
MKNDNSPPVIVDSKTDGAKPISLQWLYALGLIVMRAFRGYGQYELLRRMRSKLFQEEGSGFALPVVRVVVCTNKLLPGPESGILFGLIADW